jgi:hypothetical protein
MESSAPRQTNDVFLPGNWCLFRVSRPSVLLIGADHDTDRAIQFITADGQDSIAGWPEAGAGRLPATPSVTLLVRNVAALVPEEQERLHQWLGERSGSVQVIATTPVPLYDLVERRQFLEALYYRLNVVCLEAAAFEGASV